MSFFRVNLKTRNPLNGAAGNSRLAAIIRANERKRQRGQLKILTMAYCKGPAFPIEVTVTRVAPSGGLDPHDGLGAALKGCIDGIADGLGLESDRDPRVTWKLAQRRGRPREYAVEVGIQPKGDA